MECQQRARVYQYLARTININTCIPGLPLNKLLGFGYVGHGSGPGSAAASFFRFGVFFMSRLYVARFFSVVIPLVIVFQPERSQVRAAVGYCHMRCTT